MGEIEIPVPTAFRLIEGTDNLKVEDEQGGLMDYPMTLTEWIQREIHMGGNRELNLHEEHARIKAALDTVSE